jgi:hypothetical protein
MSVGFRSLSLHVVSVLVTAAGFCAFAPGCSSNSPATAQAGIVWTVEGGTNSGAQCPVGGADTFTIGGGNDNDDSTVPDQGKSGSTPVSINCTVSGNDSSGYNIFLYAAYGTQPLGSLTIRGTVAGNTSPQTNITATFNDSLGTIANLGEAQGDGGTGCTITYPNTSEGMGVAPGRIWAYIDCPNATDENRGYTCDANATFRFENCSQ